MTKGAEGGRCVRAYGALRPRIAGTAWLAPGAVVVGDVAIGDGSSIWYGSVVRGDVCPITIGARTNVQDLSVLHVTKDVFPLLVGDEVTIGHHATVHGCRVGDGALIGIGAIVLDGAEIGAEALVGAGAVVTPGFRVPAGHLALGAPARVVRELSADERRLQRERALHYVEVARVHRESEA